MKVQLDLAVRYRRFVQIVLVAFVIAMCGSPAAAQSYVFNAASFAAGGGPAAVAAGDLNGDGKTDLVTVGFGARAGIASVLLGKPDGSFAQHVD